MKKYNNYPKPETALDTLQFLIAHDAEFKCVYLPQCQMVEVTIKVNGNKVSYTYSEQPTTLKYYFEEYLIPCAIALWLEIYKES